jgi:hypothetical protein
MDEEKKSTKQACLWNRRGDCPGMIEKLTKFLPEQWGKTNSGKALSSDYSIKYCNFCLMAKLIEQLETVNEKLDKIYKKFTPRL